MYEVYKLRDARGDLRYWAICPEHVAKWGRDGNRLEINKNDSGSAAVQWHKKELEDCQAHGVIVEGMGEAATREAAEELMTW